MKFNAIVLVAGKTATGIEVPEHIVTSLSSSKRPAVKVTINEYMYRTTIAPTGGKFLLPVSAEVRKNTGISGEQQVEVTIELDTEPREVELPEDFQIALDSDTEAKRFFERLNYNNKRKIVIPIQEAKTEETRNRRIDKTINNLREGKS